MAKRARQRRHYSEEHFDFLVTGMIASPTGPFFRADLHPRSPEAIDLAAIRVAMDDIGDQVQAVAAERGRPAFAELALRPENAGALWLTLWGQCR